MSLIDSKSAAVEWLAAKLAGGRAAYEEVASAAAAVGHDEDALEAAIEALSAEFDGEALWLPGTSPVDTSDPESLAEEALATLTEIMRDSGVKASERLKACAQIMDRTIGKPVERIDMRAQVNQPIFIEVEHRLPIPIEALKRAGVLLEHDGVAPERIARPDFEPQDELERMAASRDEQERAMAAMLRKADLAIPRRQDQPIARPAAVAETLSLARRSR